MNNNNDLINNLLANPVALWHEVGELSIQARDLSLNAIETLCRHFGLYEPKLDGNYTFSSRFSKTGNCKIKIGHKGEDCFTVITILNDRSPRHFKDLLFHPWDLLRVYDGVDGEKTLRDAWHDSALSRNRSPLFDKDGILRVWSGPHYVR